MSCENNEGKPKYIEQVPLVSGGFPQLTDDAQSLIRRDLEEYISRCKTKPDNSKLSFAVNKTIDRFKLREKVKIFHLIKVFEQDSDIWSKSSGLPWCNNGYMTKGDIRKDPDAVHQVRKFAHMIKYGNNIEFPDCLAYVQSHTAEPSESNTSIVWDYPATVTFIEAMFALPLIRGYQDMEMELRPIAYGFETADSGRKHLCKRFRGRGLHFTSVDFKNFDKTVPSWLISLAFKILYLFNVNFLEYEDYGVPDASKMYDLFDAFRKYFVNTSIQLTNGCRFQKFSGIPREDCIFMGKDSLISTREKWNLPFCAKVLEQIGMEINMDKCEQSKRLSKMKMKFLGPNLATL